MDNLRDYGEDDAVFSSGLGRSSTKLPSSSEGLPVPTSSQALVMAASTPATTLVTSGPVPAVSALTTPASSVHKDCTVALDDLPPPPPPAEPYEVFLARVSRELSSLPVRSVQPYAAVPPRPVVATSTTGSRLPTPFPRYEDSSWALQPQAPGVRIRMPLPASCYIPPPSPWVWPGRGPAVDVTMIRGPLPTTLLTGPPGLPGPSGLPAGPPAVGPAPVPPPSTPSTELKNTSPPPPPPPPRFRGFFPGATPPFIPTASSSSVNNAALPQTPQDAGTLSQGPTPEMVIGWKEEFMENMRNCWKQFVGDAPPQSTVGPSVTHENMGPDALQQLSPSEDREASRAQHKTGSKRAGSNTRRHSGSREKSSSDHTRARVRRPPTSPDSSSPTRRMSPPAKRSRWDWREISDDSSSSDGRQRSTRPRRPWQSRSPGPRRRNSSHSPSPHRRYRSSPAPSRWSSGAGMTKRLVGRPSPSPSGGHLLIIGGPLDLPGAVSHHLRPAHRALIIGGPLHHLGRLHLKGTGPIVSPHDVTAPGLLAWNVTLTRMTRTFAFCDSGRTMMISIPPVPIHVTLLIQDNLPQWMPLCYLRKKYRNFLLTSLLLQLFRTMRIRSRIVLQTNNWYPMSARLLYCFKPREQWTIRDSRIVSKLPVLPSPLWRYGEGGLYGCIPWSDEPYVIPNRGVSSD